MLDYLKPIKNEKYDCITFFQGDDGPNSLDIEGNFYYDPGETVCEGDVYHIVLVQDHETEPEKYTNFDFFEARLLDPLEYISGLIPSGWFGIIARKTTKSDRFINSAVDNIKKLL
jgi:hypothetical protein